MKALAIAVACLGVFAVPSYAAVAASVPHPMPMPGGGHAGHGGHGGGHGHHGGKGAVFFDPFPPQVIWTLPPPPSLDQNASAPLPAYLPPAPICPAYLPPPEPHTGPRIIYIGAQPKVSGPKVIYGTD
jgi:hypothetical protein